MPARAEEPAQPSGAGNAAPRPVVGQLELACGAAAAVLPTCVALGAPFLVPTASGGITELAFGGVAAVLELLVLIAAFVTARLPTTDSADSRAQPAPISARASPASCAIRCSAA